MAVVRAPRTRGPAKRAATWFRSRGTRSCTGACAARASGHGGRRPPPSPSTGAALERPARGDAVPSAQVARQQGALRRPSRLARPCAFRALSRAVRRGRRSLLRAAAPPYAAALRDGEAFKYQADGFGEAEQRRVAELFRLLDRRGCLVMASNADCQLTRQVYAGLEIDALSVRRRIGGRQERRGHAAEIVVRNYTGRRGVLPGV
jgi:hypothetical protein